MDLETLQAEHTDLVTTLTGYRASRYFSKSWLEEDPAVRWLLLQSAPLIVPYRPNASFCATVR